MTYSFFFILITNCYKFYISVSLMQNYKIQIMNECLFKVETKISTVEMVPFLPIMLPMELQVCFKNYFSCLFTFRQLFVYISLTVCLHFFAGSKWGNNGPSGGPRTQPPPTSGPSSGSSGGGAPPTTNKSR